MIVDTLDNLKKYTGVNPLFEDVVEFLKNNDLNKLEARKALYQGWRPFRQYNHSDWEDR